MDQDKRIKIRGELARWFGKAPFILHEWETEGENFVVVFHYGILHFMRFFDLDDRLEVSDDNWVRLFWPDECVTHDGSNYFLTSKVIADKIITNARKD